MAPQTPSEVHGRVYSRGIEPLASVGYEPIEVLDLVRAVFESVLVPADLVNHPPTFGPIDDDPLYAFRQATKKYKPREVKEILMIAAGKDALRAGYEETKQYSKRTLKDRFTAEEVDPYPLSRHPLDSIISARGIKEVAEIAADTSQPESVGDLFRPKSGHFYTGFLTVENFEIPTIKPADTLNLLWRLDETQNQQVKSALSRAATKKKPIRDIWDRWEKIEVDIMTDRPMLNPPLFPMVLESPDGITYVETSSFIASGGAVLVDRAASVTPRSFLHMTMKDNENDGELNPLAMTLLEEFDDEPFIILTPSSKMLVDGDAPPLLSLGPRRFLVRLENNMKDDEELKPWRHSDASLPQVDIARYIESVGSASERSVSRSGRPAVIEQETSNNFGQWIEDENGPDGGDYNSGSEMDEDMEMDEYDDGYETASEADFTTTSSHSAYPSTASTAYPRSHYESSSGFPLPLYQYPDHSPTPKRPRTSYSTPRHPTAPSRGYVLVNRPNSAGDGPASARKESYSPWTEREHRNIYDDIDEGYDGNFGTVHGRYPGHHVPNRAYHSDPRYDGIDAGHSRRGYESEYDPRSNRATPSHGPDPSSSTFAFNDRPLPHRSANPPSDGTYEGQARYNHALYHDPNFHIPTHIPNRVPNQSATSKITTLPSPASLSNPSGAEPPRVQPQGHRR